MQTAVLRWASVNRDRLVESGLIPSLVATLEEEIRLHDASPEAQKVIEKVASQ